MCPQNIANTLHGFAVARFPPRRAKARLLAAAGVAQGGRDLTAQGLSNTVKAIGELFPGQRGGDAAVHDALSALERRLEGRVSHGFNALGLANVYRGWAKVGAPLPAAAALRAVDDALAREAHRCSAHAAVAILQGHADLKLAPSPGALLELAKTLPTLGFDGGETAAALAALATLGARPTRETLEDGLYAELPKHARRMDALRSASRAARGGVIFWHRRRTSELYLDSRLRLVVYNSLAPPFLHYKLHVI